MGSHVLGAASGFLFPVLPASPPLFWFYNQHFFSPLRPGGSAAEELTQELAHIVCNTQRPPSCLFSCTHGQSRTQKCDSSALSPSTVGAIRPLPCSSAVRFTGCPAACPEGDSAVQYVLSQDCFAHSSFLPFLISYASATAQNGEHWYVDS